MWLRQGEWSQGQVEGPMSSPLTYPRGSTFIRGLYTQGTVVVRPLLPLRTVRGPWKLLALALRAWVSHCLLASLSQEGCATKGKQEVAGGPARCS